MRRNDCSVLRKRNVCSLEKSITETQRMFRNCHKLAILSSSTTVGRLISNKLDI
jgi:hypothetical protein